MDFWNAKPSKKNRIPSFLNAPVRSMKPMSMFQKQSIHTPRRNLKPWGDIDMDGSPNRFDCNPFNPAEDGILDTVKKIFGKKDNSSKEFKEYKKDIQKLSPAARKERYKMYVAQKKSTAKKQARESARRFSVSKAVSGLAAGLAGQRYSKQSLRNQKRFTGRSLGFVRLITPPGTVAQTGKGKGKGKKGRPEGPSGKYFIPGVGAVGVYQYRTWLRQQRRIKRLEMRENPSMQSMESLEPQALTLGAQQVALLDTGEGPANQNLIDNVLPARQFNQTNRIRQPLQVRQIQPAGTGNLDYQQQMQLIMQQRDNILNAPQIVRGELAGTGGDILSDVGRPNILQAPNINLGQMRNFYARDPVTLGEKPISNPRGDYFTTIDPITGNPILQRRPREKWLTGEAI